MFAKIEQKNGFSCFFFVVIRHTNYCSNEHSQAWVVVEFMRICASTQQQCMVFKAYSLSLRDHIYRKFIRYFIISI